MFNLKRRSTRKLILRTYCWGVVPILAMAVISGGAEWLGRGGCAVKAANPIQKPLTTASLENNLACCTGDVRELRLAKIRTEPLLVSLDVAAGEAKSPALEGGAHVCVYGMNFGERRGFSTLEIGGETPIAYESWSDPGAPYGPGHYAKACGVFRKGSLNAAASLQLVSPRGTSNLLEIPSSSASRRTNLPTIAAFSVAGSR